MPIQDDIAGLGALIQNEFTNVTPTNKISADDVKNLATKTVSIATEIGAKLLENDSTDATQTATDVTHDARIAALESRCVLPITKQSNRYMVFAPLALVFSEEDNRGKMVVKTKIREGTNNMFRLDFKGYNYGAAKFIDFGIVWYAYMDSTANYVPTRKGIVHINFERKDTDIFPICIGITDDGYVAVVLGDDRSSFYFPAFTVDYVGSYGGTLDSEKGWSVQNDAIFVDFHKLTN